MQKQLKEKLIETAKEISSFPDYRFESNCFDAETLKESFFPIEGQEVSIRDLKDARDSLEKLEKGENLFIGAFL